MTDRTVNGLYKDRVWTWRAIAAFKAYIACLEAKAPAGAPAPSFRAAA